MAPSRLQALEQPRLRLAGVGHGLERDKGLRDNDHKRGLGIEVPGLLGYVVGIDVGEVLSENLGEDIFVGFIFYSFFRAHGNTCHL